MGMTEKDVEFVIQSLAQGISVKSSTQTLGKHLSDFWDFIDNKPDWEDKYERAQKKRAEMHVDEIIEIADTEIDPQRARNRIDARRWYAAKMKPQKYGERIDVSVTQQVDLRAAIEAGKQRVALPGRYQQQVTDAEVVEQPKLSAPLTTGLQSVGAEKQDASDSDIEDIFS
jgi:hypothetical protein